MAFQTYQDLKDNIAFWLNRDNPDTIARIPDFIALGENRIFRELRSRWNEKKEVYAADGGHIDGITLPSDFKEVKYLLWDGRSITRRSDLWFYRNEPIDNTQGTALYYARTEALKIEFWPYPDNDPEIVLYYYNQQPHISDSTVPELYLQFPELYLFSALLEADPYLKSKDLGEFWAGRYAEVLGTAQEDSDEAEYAGSTVDVSNVYPDNDRIGRNLGYY